MTVKVSSEDKGQVVLKPIVLTKDNEILEFSISFY